MLPERFNLLTDVSGLRVGHAHDAVLASGVTVVMADVPLVASVAIMGGAPGTRETDILAPDAVVPHVDAIVLSGGSAYGLDAAGGVQAFLRQEGRGYSVGGTRVPIVPQAICFDLLNGGDKRWGRFSPYGGLGFEAAVNARPGAFAIGSAGGGYGATTVNFKGGIGSASAVTRHGHTVAALVLVNAIGSATIGNGPHFWAAPYEQDGEFGARGWPDAAALPDLVPWWKSGAPPATTIGIVATDAILTKAQAKRLAMAAQAGLAKGLRVSHALMDGDVIFALSKGERPLTHPIPEQIELGALAADTVARAIARGVYAATALPFAGAQPAWRDRFGV